MREIKFRAWDKYTDNMVQVMRLDYPEWWLHVRETDSEESYKGYGERHSFHGETSDRFVLMQYTGIKDKNGREIYEGDVVKKDSADPDFVLVGEVYWEPDCAGWAVRFSDNRPNYTRGRHSEAEWARWEVIGNVYENPRLLEASL